MNKPLILIDGSSYFFRAFHALPPLTNSKGQPTGAIYGVANMIKKLIKDYQPEELAVVFDAKGKTFRDEWYPEYKANRPPIPVELSVQFQPLIEVIDAMGLPLLIIEGVEADDVIGTLAQQATNQGITVLISTSDKDMAQLVNEQVSLINTMSNYTMDASAVVEKFGVRPDQIIDYLTLVGDSVDNIPGVNKCGPKTAAKWLSEHQNLDKLIERADTIDGKVGEYLRASIPCLPLSKKLVTIKTDLLLPLTIHQLKPKPADKKRLIELTTDLEFKSWLKELLAPEEKIPTKASRAYEPITTQQQLDDWLSLLTQAQIFCLNTETTTLDVMTAELIGISFAVGPGKAAYIPLPYQNETSELDRQQILAALKPILENPRIQKIGQNIKYDYCLFKNYNIHLEGIRFDILLESYILNSANGRQDLETLSLKYLGHKIAEQEAKHLDLDQISIHGAEGAEVTLQLHHILYPLMDEQLRKVFQDIEMPLIPVLADMEYYGVLLNPDTLHQHGIRLKERTKLLEQEALQLAGRPFNLNSPKQLQEILFEEQKLPVLAKTPTGQASTAESVLQELAFEFRLAAVILEYRSLAKLISTYIDTLPKKINPKTQRVHTSYNQTVTATGRLSSSEPNLQNIPARSEEGRLIRTAFIAPPGSLLLAADYSQIELRIMAHLSQDEGLLKAFTKGCDIHAATASEIFHTPLDQVTQEQRRKCKAVNFGLIYGMSAFGLARQLGVDRQEAQKYIDVYFHRYPRVLEYMDKTRKQAHEQGYVETLFGRRLYLPEINASNIMRQKAAERMAINAPMQGTAADIIKKSMLAIANWQNTQAKHCAKMIMQVHDELIFEVLETEVEFSKENIRHLMEQSAHLSVPLTVSIGVGLNWEDAH